MANFIPPHQNLWSQYKPLNESLQKKKKWARVFDSMAEMSDPDHIPSGRSGRNRKKISAMTVDGMEDIVQKMNLIRPIEREQMLNDLKSELAQTHLPSASDFNEWFEIQGPGVSPHYKELFSVWAANQGATEGYHDIVASEDRENTLPFVDTEVIDETPQLGYRHEMPTSDQLVEEEYPVGSAGRSLFEDTNNEEVGFMDREISDHGQKMRNVMEAYYSGADFGPAYLYEARRDNPPEWADDTDFSQKDIDTFMAAVISGDVDYAMKNPTDFVLEEFERKWGWPLNVNSPAYQNPVFADD